MEIEIKFRAKDKFTNKWVYGDLVHNQKVTETGLEARTMVGGYEVVEDTVGQFTGLTDKNGLEVYDSDIFKLPISNEVVIYQIRISNHHLCVELKNINYEENWQQWCNLNDSWWGEFKNEIEVIGNIYDNQELIK